MTAIQGERLSRVLTILRDHPATGPGVALAASHEADELLLTSGTTARGGGIPVGPTDRFELGSLTKTFTALLLADMVARGEVAFADPIDRYLPSGAAAHVHGSITLEHLATHTSGLPRLPPGLLRSALPRWRTNPYHAFGPDRVMSALRRVRPRATPGSRVRYSNFGMGLLGVLLAGAADRPFEELLTDRVLRPLGLADTGCAITPQVTGHLRRRPRPPWTIPGLPAAGALRSTARDMLRYLQAHTDPWATPLAKALTEVSRPRVPVPRADHHLCLVWNLRHRPGHDLLFHSGGTRGFTSFAGFCPQSRTTLVALTNTAPDLRGTFIQHAYLALRELAADTD